MPRPHLPNDAVDVVRHNHEGIGLDARKVRGQLVPYLLDEPAERVESHFIVDDPIRRCTPFLGCKR